MRTSWLWVLIPLAVGVALAALAASVGASLGGPEFLIIVVVTLVTWLLVQIGRGSRSRGL